MCGVPGMVRKHVSIFPLSPPSITCFLSTHVYFSSSPECRNLIKTSFRVECCKVSGCEFLYLFQKESSVMMVVKGNYL